MHTPFDLSPFKPQLPSSPSLPSGLAPSLYPFLQSLFDLLTSSSNNLSPFSLHQAFLEFGYKLPKRLIYQILADFDGNEKGNITFDDFLQMMVSLPCLKVFK